MGIVFSLLNTGCLLNPCLLTSSCKILPCPKEYLIHSHLVNFFFIKSFVISLNLFSIVVLRYVICFFFFLRNKWFLFFFIMNYCSIVLLYFGLLLGYYFFSTGVSILPVHWKYFRTFTKCSSSI